MPDAACRLATLPDLGAIVVSGADATEFLAAQLSQAPPEPTSGRAPLAAWHDAKGRVQALFRVLHHDGSYLLITHASVVDEVTTALRRYVLRAAVAMDVSADCACAALIGESAASLAERGVRLGTEPWSVAMENDVAWLRSGPALVHAVGSTAEIERIAAALPSGSTAEVELAEIRLGIPTVSAGLRGQFLPQMLNLDVLGGVAFDKGCYPGQEIIARAQNLGTVKRRLLRFIADTDVVPPVASSLFDAAGRSAGIIVRAAPASTGIELLAVARLDALSGALACEDPAGTETVLAPLPYAVPGIEAD